ncbi:hypothetical protein TEA_011152 [Camellia sinensis var. sinensis]|uniref:Uncharacterized protein n=1 Tax=Camellia sinensis var. sinensis TaxID=542762 RepID=A0A4S4EKQ9_CAMSN|nr:hypothetical protein TEA_011152 [Camellia sinensis var. sinensis]
MVAVSVFVLNSEFRAMNKRFNTIVDKVETRINAENILEERDPQYDAMLGQMGGRIRSKPGGKLEMGEYLLQLNSCARDLFLVLSCLVVPVATQAAHGMDAYETSQKQFKQFRDMRILLQTSVVDKNKRPMPKLRNTSPESSKYEERPVPPGTLNVAQLQHITLLHQGKADDHNGHMDITKIADKLRIDVVQIQKIL